MKTIILASKSPRRKALLKQLGLKFKVVPSKASENLNPRLRPRGQAEALSLKKAQSVAERYKSRNKTELPIIISADTIVAIDDEVLGKPRDDQDARQMLRKLSGRAHSVFTGFTIIDTQSGKTKTDSVETRVYFKNLNEREIREYVKREKLSDKAGAYAIQGLAAVFVEKIEGDYSNVVGLPLYALVIELRKFGITVL